jgi:hypothetical protein
VLGITAGKGTVLAAYLKQQATDGWAGGTPPVRA